MAGMPGTQRLNAGNPASLHDATAQAGAMPATDHGGMPARRHGDTRHGRAAMDHATMDHAGHGAVANSQPPSRLRTPGTTAAAGTLALPPASIIRPASANSPLVDMPRRHRPRLEQPGVGLRGNDRKVLTYADLHSLFPGPDDGANPHARSSCT